MATVAAAGKVKLSNGQVVSAAQGGWYDGQQYWDGTLSNPGQINPRSNQQGAGQYVSAEVNAQSAAQQGVSAQQFEKYLADQRAKVGAPQPSPTPAEMPRSMQPTTSPSGAGIGYTAPTPIDLPGLYKTLSENAGISALEQSLADKAKGYADAQSKINDNPFLSEATRVGRIAKLSTDYQNAVKNDQDLLAMKKADIETQLNLQSKQFDINSQAARDALDRFNVLLQSGALDNANGDDIANLTRATGLSSQAIMSAVRSNQEKNVQTSVVSYDDGSTQGFAVINTKTGEIISKQTIAASKPSSPAKATEGEQKSYYMNALRSDAQKGLTLGQIFSIYTGYIEPDLIYQLYNANSKYGPDKGDISKLEKYGVTQP